MVTQKDLDKLRTYNGIKNGIALSENQRYQFKCINLHYLNGLDLPHTLDWYPSDTKVQLEKQPTEHKDYWNNQPPIKYDLNAYGHRCEEISENRNSIMFLGCSMTFGLGMHKEKTWPVLVADALGKTEYNLGVPAGSMDSAYRLYKEWQPVAKSSITIVAVPPHYRCEKIIDNEVGNLYQNIGQWSIANDVREGNKDRAQRHLEEELNDSSMYVSFNKNSDAIKQVSAETDSKLFFVDYVKLGKIVIGKKGRDGIHPGEQWHKNVAENVLKILGN